MTEKPNIIIVRDWHLKEGDIVKDGPRELKFLGFDGAYARWEFGEHNKQVGIGNFNFLVKDGEYYIPYNPNK